MVNDYRSNVYVLFGADTKVGVTMITTCICESIANQSVDVCCIHLDGRRGNDYINDMYIHSDKGLDDLYVKLKSKIVSSEDVIRSCIKVSEHLYHLCGTSDMLKKYSYNPEEIEILLDECKNVFDVIIIDAGSDIHLGMTIEGLLFSENLFLVTTQQYLSKKRLEKNKDIFIELGINFKYIIANKYVKRDELDKLELIRTDDEQNLFVTLPFVEYGWQCEQEQLSLMQFNNRDFVRGVEYISKYIIEDLNFSWDNERSMLEKRFKFIRHWLKVFRSRREVYEGGIQSQ